MNACNEYLELIGQKLDGCLSPEDAQRLEAHLRQCPHCRAALEAYSWVDHGLQNLMEEPPADLHGRIMDAVAKEPAAQKQTPAEEGVKAVPVKKRRFFFGPGTAMAAIAAALILLVGTGTIPLPDFSSSSTSASDSTAVEAAAATVAEASAEEFSRSVESAEFDAAMETENAQVQEEPEVEEAAEASGAAVSVAGVAAAAVAGEGAEASMSDAVSEAFSSEVFTESVEFVYDTQEAEPVSVYIYHPQSGLSTTVEFPETVDQSQVFYSVSDTTVADASEGQIFSSGEGTSIIAITYEGWTQTVVVQVGTESDASTAADFWTAGFDVTVADQENRTDVMDSFLQEEYLEMQSAVWMTDWEVDFWHYMDYRTQSVGEDYFYFSAEWRCTVSLPSAWEETPLWGAEYLRGVTSGDGEASQTEQITINTTVFYRLERDDDGNWRLAWKGSQMPEDVEGVRFTTASADIIATVQDILTQEELEDYLAAIEEQGGVYMIEEDQVLCTIQADAVEQLMLGLEDEFSVSFSGSGGNSGWITIIFQLASTESE